MQSVASNNQWKWFSILNALQCWRTGKFDNSISKIAYFSSRPWNFILEYVNSDELLAYNCTAIVENWTLSVVVVNLDNDSFDVSASISDVILRWFFRDIISVVGTTFYWIQPNDIWRVTTLSTLLQWCQKQICIKIEDCTVCSILLFHLLAFHVMNYNWVGILT